MPVIRATFSDCFAIYATLRSGEKNPLGDAIPAMGAEHVTLRRLGHALQALWIGQGAEDRPGQRLGIGAIDEEAVAAAVDRSEEHTSELQSLRHLVCRLL